MEQTRAGITGRTCVFSQTRKPPEPLETPSERASTISAVVRSGAVLWCSLALLYGPAQERAS